MGRCVYQIHRVVNIKCNKIYLEPYLSSIAGNKCSIELLKIINQEKQQQLEIEVKELLPKGSKPSHFKEYIFFSFQIVGNPFSI